MVKGNYEKIQFNCFLVLLNKRKSVEAPVNITIVLQN